MIDKSDTPQEMRRQFITFVSGGQEFGANIMTIREIRGWTETTMLPHSPDFVRGVINLRGVVILVESEGSGRLALAVDQILGQRQVVIKSFEGNYRHIAGIAAATILGDGRVALILDVDGIVSRCRAQLANAEDLKATGTGP